MTNTLNTENNLVEGYALAFTSIYAPRSYISTKQNGFAKDTAHLRGDVKRVENDIHNTLQSKAFHQKYGY